MEFGDLGGGSGEAEGDGVGDDGTESDSPREFDDGEPVGSLVEWGAEHGGGVVEEIAEEGDDEEPGDHGEEIAVAGAAGFGGHAEEEDAEEGAVGVAEGAEDDGDDANFWVGEFDPSGPDADGGEEKGEGDRAEAGEGELLFLGSVGAENGEVEIAGEASGEGIEGGAERAHGGGEEASGHEAADAWGEFAEDILDEVIAFGASGGVGREMIIDVEEDADESEAEGDGDIGEA